MAPKNHTSAAQKDSGLKGKTSAFSQKATESSEDSEMEETPATPTPNPPQTRKRHPDTPLNNPRTTAPSLGEESEIAYCLEQARDAILKAAQIATKASKRSELLNLIAIVQSYGEEGTPLQTDILTKATNILQTQVTHLEVAVRRIEKQASNPPSWASIAAGPTSFHGVSLPTSIPQSINPVSTLTSTQSERSNALGNAPQRVILIGANQKGNSRDTRNAINKEFGATIVAAINTTSRGHVAITLKQGVKAAQLLDNQDKLQKVLPFETLSADAAWHKVAIHGVPIRDFNQPNGMQLLKEEIETFNPLLKVAGKPFWLTGPDKRATAYSGSVLVAFKTKMEADHALQQRLYIAGQSLRAEKARPRVEPVEIPAETGVATKTTTRTKTQINPKPTIYPNNADTEDSNSEDEADGLARASNITLSQNQSVSKDVQLKDPQQNSRC
jgi:hypothetical protein